MELVIAPSTGHGERKALGRDRMSARPELAFELIAEVLVATGHALSAATTAVQCG